MLELPLATLVNNIKEQKITARSVMEAVYANIERYNSQMNIYRSLMSRERAFHYADMIDIRAANGESLGKLAGIPVSIKDNICIQDPELGTACGSRILENFRSPYDSTAVKVLKNEDAIIIGTSNMDEFAMGSSTETSAFGATLNPWNTEYVPGGSSGGAAVSIATRTALLALGSSTGGSIRQPASFCGIAGFKPSYGAVSRYGLVAYGSSLDQVGCLAKTAEDVAYGFSILQGCDLNDSTSAKVEFPQPTAPARLEGVKFCVLQEFIDSESIHDEVSQSFQDTVRMLQANGAIVEKRSFSLADFLIPAYYIIAFAEASSNLSRFDGIRYGMRQQEKETLDSLFRTSRSMGFGTEVKRRIMLGTFVLSAGYYDQYYGKATKVRSHIEQTAGALLQEFDYLLTPVSPFPAFKLGEKMDDPLAMYLADTYSVLPNLIRTPAISIPAKPSSNGLPIGVQLIGRQFQDYALLDTCTAIQNQSDYHKRRPPVLQD